jgi:hypothetical protein
MPAAAALKVFTRLCDEQRPLTAAMVCAGLDRILPRGGHLADRRASQTWAVSPVIRQLHRPAYEDSELIF